MRSPAAWWRDVRAEWRRSQAEADDAAVLAAVARHPRVRGVYLARRTKLHPERLYQALDRLVAQGLVVVDEREPLAAYALRHWRVTTLAERAEWMRRIERPEAVRRG